MRGARTRDQPAEVPLIRGELQPSLTSARGEADDSTTDDSGTSAAEGRDFLRGVGTRFDILLQGTSNLGEAEHKKIIRAAERKTADHSTGVSGAANRRHGSSSQGKRRLVPQPFSHLLVCDFEATCDSASASYPHEIIEFPVVCVDTVDLCVVAEFHSYVRPMRNPRLTQFCTALTGITQAQVDAAPTLPEVLGRFERWLREVVYPLCRRWMTARPEGLSNSLQSQKRHFTYDERRNPEWTDCERMICMVTDGPWDMRKFMYECSVMRDGHEFPPLFYRWVNVRHSFADLFRMRPRKLTDMLRKLGLPFLGQPHSGIDDSRNIARILIELLRRGYRVNRISTIKYINTADAAAVTQLLEELGEDGSRPIYTKAEGKKCRTCGSNATSAGGRRNKRRQAC
ncbi:exonuclease [Trypanosoma rangeli]|uniref:Exonuclease n=1 Tax=Trypanosoma rangeli TaxID=5698 RepID=A0A3R7M512_TRYRA|nr:exonuclease [Trypanosoma rangeli]RNF09140.1 exonuclease [Trypanosoma rangeli]|eukprot:RNF09140.1 exonuclease [Trypanosoma rangeli]